MFGLFFEVSLYAIPAALIAGILGYTLPGLLWVAILSAAIILLPFAISAIAQIRKKNINHPGRIGELWLWLVNIFWAEVAVWVGFLLQ